MTKPQSDAEIADLLARIEEREARSRREAAEAQAWLAAIVENSGDAILSKTLDGVIMSWNRGAERLFGYPAAEAIGRSITIIIPEDRRHEEETILRQVRAGNRIQHFETVRRRKDGGLVPISLTVSPVRNAAGEIIGASKIARDISAAREAADRQDLIVREMYHRIKNLFALATSLVGLAARSATSVPDLARDISERLVALSRAQSLTLPDLAREAVEPAGTTLGALVRAILAPHEDAKSTRISVDGDAVPVNPRAVSTLALLLHELATNAVKYGALSTPGGRLDVAIGIAGETAVLRWRERGGPGRAAAGLDEGFGSRLERATVGGLKATLERDWRADGLDILLRIPLAQLAR